MSDEAVLLASRAAWPDDLMADHRAHPRASWSARPLPQLARQWLHAHDVFRHHATLFEAALDGWPREAPGRVEALRNSVARVPGLLELLELHHHGETALAFPALARAAPAIVRAIDVLDRDHEAIARMIQRVEATLRSARGVDASLAAALDATLRPMLRALRRHLLDEEDVVIPALIAHGHLVRGL